MSSPTIDQRVTTLEAEVKNTLTKAAGTTIEATVGARYTDLMNAVTALTARVEDLETRLNDALARLAAGSL